jgi:hypothetical protein
LTPEIEMPPLEPIDSFPSILFIENMK